jgi:hypothetical protein
VVAPQAQTGLKLRQPECDRFKLKCHRASSTSGGRQTDQNEAMSVSVRNVAGACGSMTAITSGSEGPSSRRRRGGAAMESACTLSWSASRISKASREVGPPFRCGRLGRSSIERAY